MSLHLKLGWVLVILSSILSSYSISAQNELSEKAKEAFTENLQIGLFLGFASYEGDLLCHDRQEINFLTDSKIALGINVYKKVNKKIGVGFQYLNTTLSGSDALFTSDNGHLQRNFSFNNNINEFSLIMKFHPFGNKPWRLSPYISGGLGIAIGESNTNYRSENQPDFRQVLITEDINKRTTSSFGFPIGLGITFVATDKVSLNLDASLRIGHNDFLDGVSFSGNSTINDYFGTCGVAITYRLGKSQDNDKYNLKPE